MPRGTKCHITRTCDGDHLLNPQGPPLESHSSHVTVFPVNQYREAQLEISIVYDKDVTYIKVGEADGF